VVALGAPLFTYHTESAGPFLPDGATLFQMTDDADAASWLPTGTSILTSLHHGVADLLARPAPPKRPRQKGRTRAERVAPSATISVDYLMQTIAELRPPDSIIAEEGPTSRASMQAHMPIDRSQGFFSCSSGGLGFGLPAAVGIALGKPGEKVIAVIGDGSSMFAIQGLWTAGQLRLPMTFVIIRNGRYQALEDFGVHFGLAPPGTKLPALDFVALAAGHGIEGHRVDRPDALAGTLRQAFAAERPVLVEVVVD
jgi:benzoylformate decarboxylase